MEATELRIGNTITEYNLGIINVDVLDLENIVNGDTNYKPIPLTEEWLFKFNWHGYNPLHFNSNFEIDKQGRLYCNSDYKGVNVNYVHQLQNLFYCLTNKELTLCQ